MRPKHFEALSPVETLQSIRSAAGTEIERELAALDPWFHNLHLPGGIRTAPEHPLGDFPAFKWQAIAPALPEDLRGWKVLDVGCNAGFYSFELAKRGALVDAIDLDPHYLRQGEWAAEKLGLQDRVRFRRKQVYELAGDPVIYDLVWFMGVFYHLRYPLLGLDILARKTRRLMIFQSLSLGGDPSPELPENLAYEDRGRLRGSSWPRMAFVESRFAGDPTNWWVPDTAAVCAMIRTAGLDPVREIADETWLCERREPAGVPHPEFQALFPS